MSNQLAENFVILASVETSREQHQMQTRRYTGDLVNFIGVIGIIAVMSIVVVASLMGHGSMAVMPDWSERQLAALAE